MHGLSLLEEIMFKYWYNVLNFQMTTLMTVRCFRESNNLKLLLGCLNDAVQLCFALDHIHYSRWLSVFIHDLELLSVENSDLFDSLENNLGVRTSKADFSKIAFDHKHEMNNRAIKSRSGYIDLVNKDDAAFLRKLEICSAEVHNLFEDLGNTTEITKHKKESPKFNKTFVTHCNQIFSKMSVNPFDTKKFKC